MSPSICGADVCLNQNTIPQVPEKIAAFKLEFISNRGFKVWPGTCTDSHLTDIYRCRFLAANGVASPQDITALLSELEKRGFVWMSVHKLLVINGKEAFSK